MNEINQNLNFNQSKADSKSQQPTPKVIKSYSYDIKNRQEIIYVDPTTETIEDYAFFDSIRYEKANQIIRKVGALREIHLPFGIKLSLDSMSKIAIDYNYLMTGIPTRYYYKNLKIQDEIEFIIYDPITRKEILSLSYPIMDASLFVRDYNKIVAGELTIEELNSGKYSHYRKTRNISKTITSTPKEDN